MFLKEFILTKDAGCFLFFFFYLRLKMFFCLIYSCDGKAEFSASLLQSSVSHDSSEISVICWFVAQETFLLIISVKNFVA